MSRPHDARTAPSGVYDTQFLPIQGRNYARTPKLWLKVGLNNLQLSLPLHVPNHGGITIRGRNYARTLKSHFNLQQRLKLLDQETRPEHETIAAPRTFAPTSNLTLSAIFGVLAHVRAINSSLMAFISPFTIPRLCAADETLIRRRIQPRSAIS
ncbi:hypothetical protein B0H16DRAFT_1476058 [Mycena metata]|uniref:Uncharacterized protein n=1 Tax=Mycena metata TaxID=1033252 RepID=A0AAD7HCT7_9AGAR|nr:hypothetical protein B0H16DRAFT_1476058 [Mycena metata]